ncbi:hypothetical protein HBI79_162440 [Parastagonospora nodorum]|nr:hypothetical protein HBI79_162440 [Parastagonospora nodorum]
MLVRQPITAACTTVRDPWVKLAYCYLRRVAWCLVNHQPHLTPPMNIAAKHPLVERRFPVTLSATSEALCMLYQRQYL